MDVADPHGQTEAPITAIMRAKKLVLMPITLALEIYVICDSLANHVEAPYNSNVWSVEEVHGKDFFFE